MEQARLAALRDFDDDGPTKTDPPSISAGTTCGRSKSLCRMWMERKLRPPSTDTCASVPTVKYFLDGRLRRILPRQTEGDEAKAQARLKKERNQMRQASLDAKAERERQEKSERARRNKEFKARQRAANRRSRRSGGIESPPTNSRAQKRKCKPFRRLSKCSRGCYSTSRSLTARAEPVVVLLPFATTGAAMSPSAMSPVPASHSAESPI